MISRVAVRIQKPVPEACPSMNRRRFLASCLAAGGALPIAAASTPATASTLTGRAPGLLFAPHFGMFRHHAGHDLVDQLQFMADRGFRAFEENGLKSKPVEQLERIRRASERLDLQIGVFVGTADFGNPTFASGRKDFRVKVLADIRESIELARRMNARWCTVVPGKGDGRLPAALQTANAVELLKRCAALCEPAGLTMLLEPINHWASRSELFLSSVPQASEVCGAVRSPACKILVDVPHLQQSSRGFLSCLDRAWSEVAYFQIGDSPGRKEPGTGAIDCRGLFRFLRERSFRGILGMEHGNSLPGKAGERAVLDAYAALGAF